MSRRLSRLLRLDVVNEDDFPADGGFEFCGERMAMYMSYITPSDEQQFILPVYSGIGYSRVINIAHVVLL